MKLREFNFNSIKNDCFHGGFLTNLAVKEKNTNKWYEGISIGDTLKKLPLEFADMEIVETRWFFNTFVIEVERKE